MKRWTLPLSQTLLKPLPVKALNLLAPYLHRGARNQLLVAQTNPVPNLLWTTVAPPILTTLQPSTFNTYTTSRRSVLPIKSPVMIAQVLMVQPKTQPTISQQLLDPELVTPIPLRKTFQPTFLQLNLMTHFSHHPLLRNCPLSLEAWLIQPQDMTV